MQIDFEYTIGQGVLIKALKVVGVVIGLYYGETGKQYQTSYFLNGERKIIYLYGFDLSVNVEDHPTGFRS